MELRPTRGELGDVSGLAGSCQCAVAVAVSADGSNYIEAAGEVREEDVGPSACELAIDVSGFARGLQCAIAVDLTEADGEVVEAVGEVGEEGIGPSACELAIDVSDFAHGLQ